MKYFLSLVLLALPACATAPNINLCKYADIRRASYQAAIVSADALAASGRPVPSAVVLGREAAVTALAVLNTNCPVEAR